MSATQGLVRESPRERVELAQDAGYGRLSVVSVVAGVLAAYGAFVVLLAIAAAIVRGVGNDADLTRVDWRTAGWATAIGVALVMFVAYLIGGYVAGRMARRSGLLNGIAVFVLGVIIVAAVGLIASAFGSTRGIVDSLRTLGVPTSGSEWADIGSVAGIASLVAMLVGALLGGRLGERWHARLVARALDPDIGTQAEARRNAEEAALEADRERDAAQLRVAHSEGRADTHTSPTQVTPQQQAAARATMPQQPTHPQATTDLPRQPQPPAPPQAPRR